MPEPILELRAIEKRFGRTAALKGVDFSFTPGVAHALLGENGSGKSTLMKIACGEYSPTSGEILFQGEPVSYATPLQATRAGITMVAQEVPLVPALSVGENILLGNLPRAAGRVNWSKVHERAAKALAQLGSALDPRRPVASLPPGDKQIVAIARAVASDPRVVIFDEPTSSLTDERAEALFEIINRMKEQGLAIAFISQRLQDIAPVADLVTVIRDGRAVATEPVAEVDEAAITRLMVGRDLDDYFHREVARDRVDLAAPPVLEVRDLAAGKGLNGVSFDVRPGEIVGLAGLVGSGNVHIVRSIFGAMPSTGSVRVAGREYDRRTPRRSVSQGLAFVTGDRKAEGIVGTQTIAANLTMVMNNRMNLLPLNAKSGQRAVKRAMDEFQIRPPDPFLRVGGLSGGNQQKVVIGRWLSQKPAVFLLDEPTRGVDVGAKSEIYRVLRDLARQGCAILVSSSENAELIGLCDRVLTLFRGTITADLPTAGLDEADIAVEIAGVHRV